MIDRIPHRAPKRRVVGVSLARGLPSSIEPAAGIIRSAAGRDAQEGVRPMPAVSTDKHKKGDYFVDYEEKVFEDVKAEPGQKALVTFHTVAFEGSIGFVNLLQATRLQRKGFDTSVLLYGPGVTLGIQRGFPTLGDEAFPGHLNMNNQIAKFIAEGGKVYACRFALQALYGHGEPSLIEGIRPIAPTDVLDIVLLHKRDNAVIIDTWTV
jgi:uncharacterized repeat protein (TIGR04044 family)